MVADRLNCRHLRDLRSSGLTDETILESRCYSATAIQSRDILGFEAGPGLAFIYLDPDGRTAFQRIKPDQPFRNGSEEGAKYLSPKKAKNPEGNRLYFPANLLRDILDDPGTQLLLVEGEKKALACCQQGFPAVGLSGVASWLGRDADGVSRPIRDLDRIEWQGRDVVIVFDSDVVQKVPVRHQETRLASELARRGAHARVARLPKPSADEEAKHHLGGKFGADDYLVVRGSDKFRRMIDEATEPKDRKKPSAADIADQFLDERGWRVLGGLRIRFWRDEFYRFNGRFYEVYARLELEAEITKWMASTAEYRSKAGPAMTKRILGILAGEARIPFNLEPPFLIEREEPAADILSFENGLLRVSELVQARFDLKPHTPDQFTLGGLDYPFKPDADCPRFLDFLERAQPDRAVQDLVQEMMGYLLVRDTTFEKFFLLEGAGANGKTVLCTVMRKLLGATNVSSVALEAFSAVRTFPLWSTVGKLANIVEELDEIDRVSEGLIKQFVTGSSINIERKHKDGFDFRPTARLVIATNVLPRFVDRSDGLWRRMVYIPFRNQILDESEQDKRLIDPGWWQESGELPAILQWALGGLVRLRERGRFTEPEACQREKAAYRHESNPAATFLEDNVSDGGEVPASRLHAAYRRWAEGAGYRPLAQNRFGRVVTQTFPEVELTPNPRRTRFGRTRVWQGIHLMEDE